MPKTGRARSRAGMSAVAMVPRQHSDPIPCVEMATTTHPASGRARATTFGDRAPIAVLAFLLGFAACYVVLRYSDGAEPIPYGRATTSSVGSSSRLP